MYLLGLDIGSSSIKAAIIDAETGKHLASASTPAEELEIHAPQPGWAEQDPELWWQHVKIATKKVIKNALIDPTKIAALGIAYQMHGLVLIDRQQKVLRPAIIWCDSRAVDIGQKALQDLGSKYCLEQLLNSPGNFTASKLKWVQNNQPEIYNKIYKCMLPGDYIAMRLTGEIKTTNCGLSEGVFWDFKAGQVSSVLLDYYDIASELLPELVPVFANQGSLLPQVAAELGLSPNVVVAYRSGDQPNNAMSLAVLNPGEVAATAGTSGVIYGVSEQAKCDEKSRINTFLHVNHKESEPRNGILLCINGTGILYSWLKNKLIGKELSYTELNDIAKKAPIGSAGITILPFGNGAERVLENRDIGAQITGLRFNNHELSHVVRAAQEGIAFSLKYGLGIMHNVGVNLNSIRAANANLFLSPIFCETLANITGVTIDIYDTDGAQGAARAAGFGVGVYASLEQAFSSLTKIKSIDPQPQLQVAYQVAYEHWEKVLLNKIGEKYDQQN